MPESNPIIDFYDANRDRLFTLREVMALVDMMGVSQGMTRETIEYMDRRFADDPAYVWKPPRFEGRELVDGTRTYVPYEKDDVIHIVFAEHEVDCYYKVEAVGEEGELLLAEVVGG